LKNTSIRKKFKTKKKGVDVMKMIHS